jgi:hypothetical protein
MRMIPVANLPALRKMRMILVANLPALRKMRMIPVAMRTGVRFALSVNLCETSVYLCVIKLHGDTQRHTEFHRGTQSIQLSL